MRRRRRPPFQFGLLALFLGMGLTGFILAMPTWAQQMAGGVALGMAAGFLLLTGVDFLQRR